MIERTIDNEVLAVLSAGRCDGNVYFLPPRQLERKMYESVNKVLAALGGKWNRSAKGHVFTEDCTDIVDGAIESGAYTRQADMGWFPTPAPIAERIADMCDIQPGMLVLEPSCGEGALVDRILSRHAHAECVEIDERRAKKMDANYGQPVFIHDFLTVRPKQLYERVLANPPFAKRADIHHVTHARKFLKPGGKLVSIMSAGVAFREDKLATDFRAQCESIEPLPDGAFKESGTSVRTVVVTMRAAA